MTYDGTNHYVYDPEGRICAVWSPGPVYTQYIYDANGNRTAKGTIPASDWPATGATCNAPTAANGFTLTAQYLRGQAGDQDIELNGSGQLDHQNIFEGAGLAATYWNYGTAAAPTYELSYNFSDWLGTKRLQTNNNPSPETYWTSDPFGNYLTPVGTEADATGTTAPIHFTGKERDPESGTGVAGTGNDYFGARYYASTMGRFMSPDWSAQEEPVPYAKLDNPQSLNLYAYVFNDPVTGLDPNGHDPFENARWIAAGFGESAWSGDTDPAPVQIKNNPNEKAGAQQTNLTGEIRNIPKYNFALDLIGLSPNVQFNPQSSNVHPEFTPSTAAALNSALTTLNQAGIVPTFNSSFRTFADQARMQNGGSGSRPAALFSWHEAGNAVDIQPGRSFSTIRSVMQQNGFTWGGNWKGSQYDPVHFELQRPHSELFIDILKAQAAWNAQQ